MDVNGLGVGCDDVLAPRGFVGVLIYKDERCKSGEGASQADLSLLI